MIVFDLEWNNGCYDEIALNEILQIGAVRVDPQQGVVTDTFCAYICPRVHPRYSPAAKLLPELAAYEASDLDFKTAAEQFLAWSGDEPFAAWGASDYLVLLENFEYWKMQVTARDCITDLQTAFAATLGVNAQIALHKAATYCGLPTPFDFHNALNDAAYAAFLLPFINAQQLAAAVCNPAEFPRSRRQLTANLPKRKGGWRGPFEKTEEVLNNRGVRLAQCPACGRKMRVNCWYSKRKGLFYSKSACPEHGMVILRLETALDKVNRYWAATEQVKPDERGCALLRGAMAGKTFQCAKRKRSGTQNQRRIYRVAAAKCAATECGGI